MNTATTTTIRIRRLAGAGLAAFATTCVLSAPASAMNLPGPPTPVRGHHVIHPSAGSPETTQPVRQHVAAASPSTDGPDWSSLTTGLLVGVGLSGACGLAAAQTRRYRHAHAA